MPRLVTVAGSVLVLAATLTGCGPGGNAEPGKLPSNLKTSTPAPTATPSAPTAPTRPAAVRKKTKAGAIAATRYFLATMGRAGESGDTSQFRGSYIDYCTRCEAIADGIDKTYAAGGSVEGGTWTPVQFTFYGIAGNVASVDTLVDIAPETWLTHATAEPRKSAGKQNRPTQFNLRWSGSAGWRVSALDPSS